jgi:hypothetical protein
MSERKLSPEAQRIEDFFARRDMARAEAWIPEPGAYFVGTVEDMTFRSGDFGEYLRVVYKKDDGDRVAVHVFHQLLINQLQELRTKVGSRQIVSYLGQREKRNATDEQKAQGKDKYHDYYVENWDHKPQVEPTN